MAAPSVMHVHVPGKRDCPPRFGFFQYRRTSSRVGLYAPLYGPFKEFVIAPLLGQKNNLENDINYTRPSEALKKNRVLPKNMPSRSKILSIRARNV